MKIARRSAVFALALLGLIFLPAGTLNYWQAWTLIGVYAISGTLLGVYMRKHKRALFELRMKQGPQTEKSPTQRVIVTLLCGGLLAQFVVAALDHRFGWLNAPPLAAIAGDAIVLVAFYVYFIVIRENSSHPGPSK